MLCQIGPNDPTPAATMHCRRCSTEAVPVDSRGHADMYYFVYLMSVGAAGSIRSDALHADKKRQVATTHAVA